jgi:medium-chain acyl-[acyl-carrier-protein] hydrolase
MSGYFFTPKPNPNAKKRLFCFPYAGGQAAIYFDWHQYFSDDVEIVTVQLPGRGERFLDPLITDLTTAIAEMCSEFTLYFDKPFSIFGHSNGALFAYELIKQLSNSSYIKKCENLFLSAKSAPKLCYLGEPLHHKNDEDFKQELHCLGATPDEILNNQDVLDLLLPMIKSDFKIGHEYVEQFNAEDKVSIQTTLFSGKNDLDVTEKSMADWQEFLRDEPDFIRISGGHFFIHEQKEELIEHIKTKL